MTQVLTMWTVYDHPLDCPRFWVARKWEVHQRIENPVVPTGIALLSQTLQGLRELIMAIDPNIGPHGYLPRHPNDDPVIVETWV